MTSQVIPFTSNPDQQNYFNPIRKHLKKTISNNTQNRPKPETAPILNSHKQLRFKDLSKDKLEFYTQLPKKNEDSFGHMLKKDSSMSSIRKRLFENAGMSRQKSMSFTDVIKQSRQKRLRQESNSSKLSIKKQTKCGKKEGKVFNALKTRLLGENNPNAGNIIKPAASSKNSFIQKPPKPIPKTRSEQIDMVRISTQFQSNFLNKSLQMTPL